MTKTVTKEEWIEALRSGKYAQGTNYLHRNGTFCCLGVYCELKGYSKQDIGGGECTGYITPSSNSRGFNDNNVYQNTTSLDPEDFDFEISDNFIAELMNMNDSGNWSFKYIADYIEDNL